MTECIEFYVKTECNREFAWSACDLEQLLRDLVRKGYRATFIQEMSEYEAEMARREAQEVLNAEITKAEEETAA
jgi:hypothetical protein